MRKSKRMIVLTLAFITAVSTGCFGGSYVVPEPPGRITYTKAIDDALEAATTPILPLEEKENIQYHVIIDSRICNSATGFYGSGCTSFKGALSLVDDALYNKNVTGYYTTTEYTVRDENKNVVGTTVYKVCDDIFQKVALHKVSSTTAYPAEVIQNIDKEIADKVEKGTAEDNVWVYVTDLAMPGESDVFSIKEALKHVIGQKNLTVGLIGFKADYSADAVQDLPHTITHRGLDLKAGKIYQKNAYILLAGEKRAVFDLMDTYMERCEGDSTFSEEGKVECVYYYKYACNSTVDKSTLKDGQQFVSVKYSDAIERNMTENDKYSYDYDYVFLDVPEEEETTVKLKGMPLSKIYLGVQNIQSKGGTVASEGSTLDSSITFVFDYPFEITAGVGKPKSKKLGDASSPLDLNQMSFTVSTGGNAGVFRYNSSSSGWEFADSKGLFIEKVEYEKKSESDKAKTLVFTGSLDFSKMKQDEPAIFAARLAVNIEEVPEDAIKKGYNISWLKDWEMDQVKMKEKWMQPESFEESMKTPCVNEIFGESLYEDTITENKNGLRESSNEYIQTSVFGLVLREQVFSYNREKDWEEDEDFGWAFSRSDIDLLNRKR